MAGSLVVLLVLATFLAAPSSDAATGSVACGDGVVHWHPTKLWNPDHTLRRIHVSYTVGSVDMDTIGLQITDATDSDLGHEHGTMLANNPDWRGIGHAGTSTDDGTSGPAKVGMKLRAERPGHRARTYTVSVSCHDDGNISGHPVSGTAQFRVVVPHDNG